MHRGRSKPTECGLVYLLAGAVLSSVLEFWFATTTAIGTFKTFYRTRSVILYSQNPIACPYESSPSIHKPFCNIHFNNIVIFLRPDQLDSAYPSVFLNHISAPISCLFYFPYTLWILSRSWINYIINTRWGPGVALWLRHCATRRTVLGSILGGVAGFFSDIFPSDKTMNLGSTQPLVEMSTRNIPGRKGGRWVRLTAYHHTVPLSRNMGALTS